MCRYASLNLKWKHMWARNERLHRAVIRAGLFLLFRRLISVYFSLQMRRLCSSACRPHSWEWLVLAVVLVLSDWYELQGWLLRSQTEKEMAENNQNFSLFAGTTQMIQMRFMRYYTGSCSGCWMSLSSADQHTHIHTFKHKWTQCES